MIFTVFLVFTFALALVLSFYFSGTEAGFLGLSREKLHADIKQQRRGADALRPFAEHVPLFLAVVLFGNTFANVTATFLANKLWQKFLGETYLTLFVLLSTGCFLLVGEIFPKIFFRRYSPGLLYATSRVLLFFRRLLHPFVSAVLWLERLGSGAAGRLQTDGEQPAGQPDVSRADLQELMSAGLEEGVFSEQELAFINNLSSFSRITAEEVMKPLVKLFMLHERQELDSVMNIIEKQTSRYIPVYRSRIDNLTGYIDLLSVFRSNKRKKMFVILWRMPCMSRRWLL